MATVTEDIEAVEVIAVAALVLVILYSLYRVGSDLPKLLGNLWEAIKEFFLQLWQGIVSAFNHGGGDGQGGGMQGSGQGPNASNSGGVNNPNSVPPTSQGTGGGAYTADRVAAMPASTSVVLSDSQGNTVFTTIQGMLTSGLSYADIAAVFNGGVLPDATIETIAALGV